MPVLELANVGQPKKDQPDEDYHADLLSKLSEAIEKLKKRSVET